MKKSDAIFSIVFLVLLTIFGMSTCFLKRESFSYSENRYLQEFPKWNIESFRNGNYQKKLETFVDDHFLLRKTWIKIRNNTVALLGKKEVENVYLGKENNLFEKVTPLEFDEKNFWKNLNIMECFSKKYANVSILLVPSKGYILKADLPTFAPYIKEQSIIEKIKTMDINFTDIAPTFLTHNQEYLYYKTDHHWTTLGAFYAYQTWKKDDVKNDYVWEKVSENFRGSLDSKVLGLTHTTDEIDIVKTDDLILNSNRNLYELTKLQEKDQYQVFLGGNSGEISIETKNQNHKSILVLKDSYANSFIPFLLSDYQYIHIVDLRYFNQNFATYIEEINPSEILILYGINNLASDIAIHKIENIK